MRWDVTQEKQWHVYYREYRKNWMPETVEVETSFDSLNE